MPSEIQRCRICKSETLTPILDLGQQYLTGVFPHSTSEKVTRGPLELVKCGGTNACGLVQLRHSYDSNEMYGANYGYRSGLNRSMVEHLKSKVSKLLQSVSLSAGDVVLDIGSNDGTLLSFYPEHLSRVGMDPTAAKFREFYKPGINVIADFFSAATFRAQTHGAKPKIITSIAMFYDLEEPIRFVEQIAETLADDGIWHFEQSYMPAMLEQNAYDTVCHEHLEYYALRQIEWMLDRCGLKILNVELNDTNGGSFALTVSKIDAPYEPDIASIERMRKAEMDAKLDTLEPYVRFKERVFKHRDQLLALLGKLRGQNAKVLGYGASTKGNVILQFCNLTPAEIPAMTEVNPDKFGAFTPGTNIPIISEAEAHAQNPDYFLVMPWHFRVNLLEREADYLKNGGKMI